MHCFKGTLTYKYLCLLDATICTIVQIVASNKHIFIVNYAFNMIL
jgi:hypothetical protein